VTTKRLTIGMLFGLSCLLAPSRLDSAQSDQAFIAKPTWQPATPDVVQASLTEFLITSRIAPDRQAVARELWSASAAEGVEVDLLERLAACLAKVDDRVAALVTYCSQSDVAHGKPLPEFAWLADSETPLLIRNNIRLYLARWLVQEGYYDEALAWTEGLSPADVAAPEALLFYRAVAHQRLVQPDQSLAALSQLVVRRDELPVRYQKLADLMQQDLASLEDESLDHIARRMEDIRRRLAQGRSGERVQTVENGVIESLDRLIKKIEDQMQQQQAIAASTPANSPQSQAPMQDSQIAELKAPGKVQQREIGDRAGWGNMPDKDREKALQDIGREFPSHYREIIEEYFRRLAADESGGR
jgi:hypothetical protein